MSATLIRLVSVGTLTVMFPLASVSAIAAPAPDDPKRPPVSPAGHGVHFIYLVRHGECVHDKMDEDDERVPNGLDSLGHEQTRLIAKRLAALPVTFDRLVSSELLRSKQTAADIGAILHISPVCDPLLDDCEPTSDDPARMEDDSPKTLASCDSTRARAYRRYFTPTPAHDTYTLLVCHGHMIRWTLMKALSADTRRWPDQDAANAALTIVAVRPDASVRLVTYNDTSHIPIAKQTWSGNGGGWLKDD